MGSIPAGNVREGYKPCKKRDDTTRVSSLTNEAGYLFFYRAPARDRGSYASEVGHGLQRSAEVLFDCVA